MRYTLPNGKSVNIPDKDIKIAVEKLDLTEEEAIQMWLEDNDYLENDEQNALDEKAKGVKIQHDAVSGTRKKSEKPRTVKISDEKQILFSDILVDLLDIYNENVTVLKENKLIEVKIGEKVFKIDVIETRNKAKN